MLQFFMNPLMLIGLAGVALPVLAHLLSRRKFDVVNWGAMQFLNPSRKTRQKMRLEELLLLLVRIGIIALLGFALARPWINSGFLMGYSSAGNRDVVLIIDGSNSMARSDGLTSLHQKAMRRAKEFLTTLGPGDTVSLIDARDLPIKVVDSPIQDFQLVREKIDSIPPASGAADLRRSCEEAVGILGRCSNGAREIVVFTDRQKAGWDLTNEASWQRFNEILKFPAVRPSVWVMDLSQGLSAITQNISVGKIDVSRELTPIDYPVSVQVSIRNAAASLVNVPIQVLINGQRVANLDSTISVPAGAETIFSRTLRFTKEGTNLVSVRADLPSDTITTDNQSDAAVRVTPTIPILLVESSKSFSKRRWNTFFAQLALDPPQANAPWIRTRTVKATDLTPQDLETVSAVVLADVYELPDGMPAALKAYAAAGNGIFITLGDGTSAQSFEDLFQSTGLFSGLKLKRIRAADPDAEIATTIAPYSIEAQWLTRFRERKGASLLRASFNRWWLVEVTAATEQAIPLDLGSSAIERPPDASEPEVLALSSQTPVTMAQLITGDPLLLQAVCGRGSVLIMTSNLDAKWNSLPTQSDFVPFLHEALFQLASSSISRNVEFGAPLLTQLPDATAEASDSQFDFKGPFETESQAEVITVGKTKTARLPVTRLPGVYQLNSTDAGRSETLDTFVVNYDHSEDNPPELSIDDRAYLANNNRMTFVDSVDALRKSMYSEESRSELWSLLIWLFLGMLTFEVWMIRRLINKGYGNAEASVVA